MSSEKVKEIKEQGESPGIMKWLNTLIIQGLSSRAISMLLELEEWEVTIRQTIDGMPVFFDGEKWRTGPSAKECNQGRMVTS